MEYGKINQVSDSKQKAMLEETRRNILAQMMVESNEKRGYFDEEEILAEIHDEFDLSARNVLIVDSILNRKGKKYLKK